MSTVNGHHKILWLTHDPKDASALVKAGYRAKTFTECVDPEGSHVAIVTAGCNDYLDGKAVDTGQYMARHEATSVKLLQLSPPNGMSIADFLGDPHTPPGVLDILYENTPPEEYDPEELKIDTEWLAGDAEPGTDGGRSRKPGAKDQEFSNFETYVVGEGENMEERRRGLRIGEIDAQLPPVAGDWPKRVGERLFVQTDKLEALYLKKPAQLFAWIDARAKVNWTKGAAFITQERYFEHKRMTTERYDAIETLPHWPPMPGTYYMHPEIGGPGNALEGLLDFFRPSSIPDRQLIKAMILTLFWGGPPGDRPAFLVTGPDNDPGRGRGIGKSDLTKILADCFVGGSVDVTPTESIADIKTRLLSSEAGRKRVVRIDNLKTHRFSWGDLEGLISSSEISGKALFEGEGRRPNSLVWMITLNGASLSTDMAQRCIIVKLDRPTYTPTWGAEVRGYIRDNMPALLGDIRSLLESESDMKTSATRWGPWASGVLSKVGDPITLQSIILDRQKTADDDDEDKAIVTEFIIGELDRRSHDPDKETILLPARIVAEWASEATRHHYPTNKATAFIKGLAIPQLRQSRRGGVRGFYWIGEHSEDQSVRALNDLPEWEVKKKPQWR